MLDTKALADATALIVKQHVAAIVAPLLKRIEELEARAPEKGEKGDAGEPGPPGNDGQSVTIEQIADMVHEAVYKIPEGIDGKDVDPAEVQRIITEAVAAIPPAQPGKDADPEQVAAMVKSEAARILAGWDRPKDGESVTVEQVAPLINEAVSKAVAALPVPKDGADIAGGTIDRNGHLIITLSNGQTKDFGLVVGRDGSDADMAVIEQSIVEKVAAIPKPKDGLDGLGFKDMDLEFREEAAYFVFTGDDIQKEARLPIPYDRGVFREQIAYFKGNTVTWGGSTWIAKTDDPDGKPDAPNSGWRLCNKKGRDGKDADGKGSTKPVKV